MSGMTPTRRYENKVEHIPCLYRSTAFGTLRHVGDEVLQLRGVFHLRYREGLRGLNGGIKTRVACGPCSRLARGLLARRWAQWRARLCLPL